MEQKVGTCVDNWPPTVIHSQAAVHGYLVANIKRRLVRPKRFRLLLFFSAYHYYYTYIIRYLAVCFDYVMNLNGFTQKILLTHCPFKTGVYNVTSIVPP